MLTSSSAILAGENLYFRDLDVVSGFSRAAVTRRLCDLKRRKRSGAAVESNFGQCAKFAAVVIRYIHKRSWIESLRSHEVDTVVSPRDHPTSDHVTFRRPRLLAARLSGPRGDSVASSLKAAPRIPEICTPSTRFS